MLSAWGKKIAQPELYIAINGAQIQAFVTSKAQVRVR